VSRDDIVVVAFLDLAVVVARSRVGTLELDGIERGGEPEEAVITVGAVEWDVHARHFLHGVVHGNFSQKLVRLLRFKDRAKPTKCRVLPIGERGVYLRV